MSDGKVAIVTGAANGLGRVIRTVLERDGATVVGVDLAGDDCVIADASTADGAATMVDAALDRHGRLDVLVLNAGITVAAPLPELEESLWDRHVDLMLKGPFLTIQRAWPALTERPGGRIIVISSTMSFTAEPHKAAYVSAKHGVAGLVKSVAVEGGPHGLTANAVAPGWMTTDMVERQIARLIEEEGATREGLISAWSQNNPAGRPVETTEVAEVVAFLASDRSSGVSGTVIPVELGQLATY